MNKAVDWNVPKWPFLLGDGVLLAFAWFFVLQTRPIGLWQGVIAAACVGGGAILGIVPFVLEYRATARLIEVNGLETVVEKIQRLDQVANQIAACTDDWTTAQTQAEKTAAGARETTEHMNAETQRFTEFMQRMNDAEKSSLRLEADKMRRAEGEWLQVLMRILEHVFALHAAAENSAQPKVAGQVAQFHNACLDAARRVGLVPFGAQPNEPFNGERHQAVGLKGQAPSPAVVGETVGPGFKYQGRVVRPVLVRLQENRPATEESPNPQDSAGELALEPTE
jgi:molecular chaperone GrpE (heat shock protein)